MTQHQPDGYLALPPSDENQAVLVLHAWWGLNDTIKGFCDRLAESGFMAFAPDLYHGKIANDIDGAEALAGNIFNNLDQARTDVAEAVDFLSKQANQSSLAVIGFSLGAFFALDVSMTDPERIRSVVVFYGTHPGDFENARAAYLGHFAETDEFEPQSEVDGLKESLEQAGRPVTFYQYTGTGHWFFEADRPRAYNEAAANLAWKRTLEFLQQSFAS